jgi:5'-nucleotidase
MSRYENRPLQNLDPLTKANILLTNDDGYGAEGLRALQEAVEDLATVWVAAPLLEQSGTAQSLTLRRPIVVHSKSERHWAVDGTPADAVIVALHKLLPERPDVVISGINHGANMGENVYYSGTVGAAREAALHHIPAIAMSLCARRSDQNFANAARIARAAAELVLKEGLPDQILLNVNVPEPWSGEVKFTRQSKKITRNQLTEGIDPKGRKYYWIFEQKIDKDIEPETDYAAVFAGHASVTPLHLDPTHDESLEALARWAEPLSAIAKRKTPA